MNIYTAMLAHAGIMRRPLMAPSELNGFGGFGGGGSGEGAGDDGDDQDDGLGGGQTPLIGQQGEEQNQDDDIFSAFNDPAGDDDDDDDDAGTTPDELTPEAIQAMQTNVQNTIKNMRIPDNLIPEDFDPNNRQQLTQVLNQAMQATIAQSLNVVFQPVQMAMKQMAASINSSVDSKIRDSSTGMREQGILEQTVPEINNPKYSGLIRGMDSTLKAKGKSAPERAKTIRKMLNQMGVTEGSGGGNRRASGNRGGNNQSVKTGHAALDSFFGEFKPQAQK